MEADNSETVQHSCSSCTKPCLTHCGKCAKVFYCSRECQQSDWKGHKALCFPVDICICPATKRRRLVATKPIVAGCVIWKEKPLVFGCFDTTKYDSFQDGRDKTSYCSVCCAQIKPDDSFQECPRCTRSMCSEQCCNNAVHMALECPVFTRLKLIGHRVWYNISPSDFVILLRMMNLQKRNPPAYKTLLSLNKNPNRADLSRLSPSHSELNEDLMRWLCSKPERLQDATKVEKGTWMKLGGTLDVLRMSGIHDFSIPEVNDLLEIMHWNCVDDFEKSFVKWLCPYGSSFRHSCVPNVDWRVDPKTKIVHFRALRDLAVGEEVTMSKASFDLFKATPHRRRLLHDRHNFYCDCARCADPTELGSYAAARKCPNKSNCSDGWLLLENPTVTESGWKCTHCHYTVPQVKELKCWSTMQRILLDHCPQAMVLALQQLLKDYEDIILHPMNQDIYVLKEVLILKIEDLIVLPLLRKETMLNGGHGKMSVRIMAKFLVQLAQQLLECGNPGIGPFLYRRGRVLVSQYCAAAYIFKFGSEKDLLELSLNKEKISALKSEAEDILNFVPDFKHKNLIAMMSKVEDAALE